jgi:hypothetical protein
MATFPTSYVAGAGLSAALQGTANFNLDTIKVALFQNTIGTATPSKNTAHAYGTDPFEASGDGQVVSTGYVAGGQALSNPSITYGSDLVIFDDTDASMTWTGVTLTARGALVYSVNASNLVLCAINFNSDRGVIAGNFRITWDPDDGIFYINY